MQSFLPIRVKVFFLLTISAILANPQTKEPLRLVQKIPIPNVKGRLDHLDADVRRKRLFVAGLENGSLEVLDLQAGKWIRSIPGFKKPQGPWYVAALDKLFVASGDDGLVRVFRGDTLDILSRLSWKWKKAFFR